MPTRRKTSSILLDVKKLLGLTSEYTVFDRDIIININSAFSSLWQLGVGPSEGYTISGEEDSWEDFLNDENKLEFVKQYVYLKTKIIFDPSASSAVTEAYNKQISELEWRMNVFVDHRKDSQNDK